MPLYGRAAGDYREYADRASFDVTEITISLWVKWNSTTSSAVVAARGSAAGEGQWRYGTNSSGHEIFLVYISGANRIATTGVAPRLGVWQHVVCTYQQTDGAVRLYRGNEQIASLSYSAAAMGASTAAIRLFQDAGTNHADCVIGEFGLWNILLSTDDRNALYSGVNPASVQPNALVIRDRLDSRASIDTAGMAMPTDAGNLVATPRDFPYSPIRRLRALPGPSNVTRRRRAAPAGGTVTGTGAVTTAAATASGAGRVIHKGTGTPGVTTATVTASGAGKVVRHGTGSVTTGNVTASGAGVVEHSGSGAVTTGAATASGSGKVVHPGSGSVTTGTTTASGAGRLVHVTTGAPGVTTGTVTASGSGITVGTQTGTGGVTTGAATASGAGRVVHRGSGGVTCGAVTCDGVGVGPSTSTGSGSSGGPTPRARRQRKLPGARTYYAGTLAPLTAPLDPDRQAPARDTRATRARALVLALALAEADDEYGLGL